MLGAVTSLTVYETDFLLSLPEASRATTSNEKVPARLVSTA